MELRNFIAIFIAEKRLIATILIAALAIGFFAYRLQAQWYTSTVLFSVTRIAPEETADYRYDQLYRLQADERMADTVARYLESGIGMKTAVERAELSAPRADFFIEGKVRALRTSSQLIQVKYRAKTATEAERLADALLETGERYAASLNEQARDRNWFTLLATDPFIKDGRFTLLRSLFIALASGALLAFWTVLIRWYWQGGRGKSDAAQQTLV